MQLVGQVISQCRRQSRNSGKAVGKAVGIVGAQKVSDEVVSTNGTGGGVVGKSALSKN